MTVKVISLNLWWGGNLFPAIIEFLKAENADILMLQEVHNGSDLALKDRQRSLEVLQRNLDYQYHDFAPAFLLSEAEAKIPFGNAVLSRYPIKHRASTRLSGLSRDVYLDVPEQWPTFPRLLQRVQLETAIGAVNVFNMHGVWDIDGNNYSPARRRMSEIIIAETAGLPNVILAGDSNAKASNQAMLTVEKHLKSVFGQELSSTFNMKRKNNLGYASAAVDLMFTSPNIAVLSKECPAVDISDHLPLVVTVEIN